MNTLNIWCNDRTGQTPFTGGKAVYSASVILGLYPANNLSEYQKLVIIK